MPRPAADAQHLTPAELAAVLRMSPGTVYRLIHAGELPGTVRIGSRMFRIPAATARQFLAARGIPQSRLQAPAGKRAATP